MIRKAIALGVLAGVLGLGAIEAGAQEPPGRGGFGGFFIGCCLGVRTVGEWNEGKDLHWRDLVRFVPYVNYVFGIWDGIEGMQGITTQQLRSRYGASFY